MASTNWILQQVQIGAPPESWDFVLQMLGENEELRTQQALLEAAKIPGRMEILRFLVEKKIVKERTNHVAAYVFGKDATLEAIEFLTNIGFWKDWEQEHAFFGAIAAERKDVIEFFFYKSEAMMEPKFLHGFLLNKIENTEFVFYLIHLFNLDLSAFGGIVLVEIEKKNNFWLLEKLILSGKVQLHQLSPFSQFKLKQRKRCSNRLYFWIGKVLYRNQEFARSQAQKACENFEKRFEHFFVN